MVQIHLRDLHRFPLRIFEINIERFMGKCIAGGSSSSGHMIEPVELPNILNASLHHFLGGAGPQDPRGQGRTPLERLLWDVPDRTRQASCFVQTPTESTQHQFHQSQGSILKTSTSGPRKPATPQPSTNQQSSAATSTSQAIPLPHSSSVKSSSLDSPHPWHPYSPPVLALLVLQNSYPAPMRTETPYSAASTVPPYSTNPPWSSHV